MSATGDRPKKSRPQRGKAEKSKTVSNMGVRPAIGVAEALSFLKETKGQVSWTAKDMAGALRIGAKEAARALALLQIQGYVKSAGGNQWLTTPEGEAVSGAKTPRYSRESVEQALRALKERITEFNRDSAQEYKVAEALAYGDFLNGSAQVQAADVGLRVAQRNAEHGRQSVGRGGPESAVEQAALNALLRKLRGRTALLHPRPYEAWMSHRSHMKLL